MINEQKSTGSGLNAIDSIEHELYDPKAKVASTEIHKVKSRRAINLPTSWGDDTAILLKKDIIDPEKGFSFGAKLLLIATLLLLLAIGFLGWRIVSQRNLVSASNIDMTADITPFVEGGELTPLVVTLRNRNRSPLQSANVTLLYKQGNGSQDEQEKIQEKRDLGTINMDEYKKQDFKVALYGSEAETRDIVLKLEYKVLGSNAVFNKIITTQVVLRSPPIAVNIEGPTELSVGQSGTYSFSVKNNTASTSLPSILSLTLPNNFKIDSTNPKPIARTNSFTIDPLQQGGSQTVTVVGSFDGKQGEVGTFQAKVGSRGDNASTIGIVYSSQTTDVTLKTSPLALSMNLSTDTGSAETLHYGDRATLTFVYNNTSLQALQDVSIKLSLSGDAAVYNSIEPTSGYYDSIAKTVTWDKASLADLAVLAPNSQAVLRVIIPIVKAGNNSPQLKATLVGSASTKSQDDIVTTVAKTYIVQGSATLDAHTQYKMSSFVNSGPIPPRPNQETTYTANLKISAQNTLSSAKASFTLPAYVTWRGVFSDNALVTYNAKTRTVSWDAGRIEQGRSMSVDIGLSVKPSQSHVGQSPVITSGIILDADEDASGAHLRTTLSALTTFVNNETWPQNPSIVVDK